MRQFGGHFQGLCHTLLKLCGKVSFTLSNLKVSQQIEEKIAYFEKEFRSFFHFQTKLMI